MMPQDTVSQPAVHGARQLEVRSLEASRLTEIRKEKRCPDKTIVIPGNLHTPLRDNIRSCTMGTRDAEDRLH